MVKSKIVTAQKELNPVDYFFSGTMYVVKDIEQGGKFTVLCTTTSNGLRGVIVHSDCDDLIVGTHDKFVYEKEDIYILENDKSVILQNE